MPPPAPRCARKSWATPGPEDHQGPEREPGHQQIRASGGAQCPRLTRRWPPARRALRQAPRARRMAPVEDRRGRRRAVGRRGRADAGPAQYRGRLHVLELYARVRRGGAGAGGPVAAGGGVGPRTGPAGAGAAPRRTVVRGAGGGRGRLGAGNRQAGPAAQSLLRAAAIADRGLRLGLQAAPGQPDQFAVAAVQRFRAGRGGGLPDRRGDRLVARAGLLGASGAALPGTGAVDRAPADGVLLLSVRLVGGGVPDRAGNLVSRHRADLVRRGGREPRLLRRGAHHGRQRVVPGAARGHTGGAAAGLRGPVHGAGRVVLGVGGR